MTESNQQKPRAKIYTRDELVNFVVYAVDESGVMIASKTDSLWIVALNKLEAELQKRGIPYEVVDRPPENKKPRARIHTKDNNKTFIVYAVDENGTTIASEEDTRWTKAIDRLEATLRARGISHLIIDDPLSDDFSSLLRNRSKEVNSSAIESILLEAHRIVNNEKRTEYGPVEESFARIASLWSVVLNQNITPRQVALCMIAFKLARELHKHKRDNLVDLSAYSHLLNELERK